MANLLPSFELPTIKIPQSQSELKYRPSPNFDFEVGDFVLNSHGRMTLADGREAFEQWCLKTCMVERSTKLAYSDKIGVEMIDALRQPSSEAIKSAIIRTITEALSIHPAVESVRQFEFKLIADRIQITFTVKARNLSEIKLSVTY